MANKKCRGCKKLFDKLDKDGYCCYSCWENRPMRQSYYEDLREREHGDPGEKGKNPDSPYYDY